MSGHRTFSPLLWFFCFAVNASLFSQPITVEPSVSPQEESTPAVVSPTASPDSPVASGEESPLSETSRATAMDSSVLPGQEANPSGGTLEDRKSPIDKQFLNWDPFQEGTKKAADCFKKLAKAFQSNNPKRIQPLMTAWAKQWINLDTMKKSGDLKILGNALAKRCFVELWRGAYPLVTVMVKGKKIAVTLKREGNEFRLGLLYDCKDGFGADFYENLL